MSVNDHVAAVLSQLAMSGDGALLGLALAYVAVRSIVKFTATSSALCKICHAPTLQISDLRAVLSDDNGDGTNENRLEMGKLVIVRGIVEAKSAVEGNWKNFRPGNNSVLVSHESGEKGVILQRTQTYIYHEWRGMFGWTAELRSILFRSWKEQESSTTRMVPFVLVQGENTANRDYILVNMEGSRHSLPLTTVYHTLQPIPASPYTFLQALFGHDYPVGVLDEEKLVPLGKDLTAVGICSLRNGIPEIKSCKDLPYFLSDLNKDQMVADLSFRSKVLMWSGVVFGSLAIGILSYATARSWNRWKQWRRQRQSPRQEDPGNEDVTSEASPEEDTEDVPDGELCAICLMRRRRSAFIPCGHLVCCQRCALSVERDTSPKCPVCRQSIRSSVRIYDS